MYKVMYWHESLANEKGIAKVEHYFTDSKNAIDYFFGMSESQENIALVVSTDNIEFVFMHHFASNFPEDLKPKNFYINCVRFNKDGSVEEI